MVWRLVSSRCTLHAHVVDCNNHRSSHHKLGVCYAPSDAWLISTCFWTHASYHIKSLEPCFLNPRRHRGGGGDATPLGFSKNNSRSDRPIVTKLCVPNIWTILHLPWSFRSVPTMNFDLWPNFQGHVLGVDITISITCSVFEPDPMTSQRSWSFPTLIIAYVYWGKENGGLWKRYETNTQLTLRVVFHQNFSTPCSCSFEACTSQMVHVSRLDGTQRLDGSVPRINCRWNRCDSQSHWRRALKRLSTAHPGRGGRGATDVQSAACVWSEDCYLDRCLVFSSPCDKVVVSWGVLALSCRWRDASATSPTSCHSVLATCCPALAVCRPVLVVYRPEQTTCRPALAVRHPVLGFFHPAYAAFRPVLAICRPVLVVCRPVPAAYRPVLTTSRPVSAASRPVLAPSRPVQAGRGVGRPAVSTEPEEGHGAATSPGSAGRVATRLGPAARSTWARLRTGIAAGRTAPAAERQRQPRTCKKELPVIAGGCAASYTVVQAYRGYLFQHRSTNGWHCH